MGSFSINTNVTSLQAQNNLAASAAFQAKTINEVTSGLRIVNSGDDAAGLAVANSLRSDQATLTQGIQNANNGLSTLQTIDGGINNISTLLDRAATLAAQSASGTFTGDRSTLNSEYQSVLGEINRQAQAIGLDTGGTFAKSLSVFIGGGTAGDGATAVQNGTIGIDLSNSAVDGQALGLSGTHTSGVTGTDIGNGGQTTVANILAANGSTVGVANGTTSFVLTGAGFSGAAAGTNNIGSQTLTVSLSGVTDTASLVTAINSAIGLATTTAGVSNGSALANAGIVASVSTDATGKQQLTFSSGTAAFQVQAGDSTANGLLGNFAVGAANASTAQALSSTATGSANIATTTTQTTIRVQGTGLSTPQDFTIASGQTSAQVVSALNSTTTTQGKALTAAGIVASVVGGKLTLTSSLGGSINVATAGDTANNLGFGTFISTSGAAFNSLAGTTAGTDGIFGATLVGNAAAIAANSGQQFQISVAGGTAINIGTGALAVAADAPTQGAAVAAAINLAIKGNATLTDAGLKATSDGTTGALEITSSNGTAFRLNATAFDGSNTSTGTATDLGFGVAGATTAASTENVLASNSNFTSAGASATVVYAFNPTSNQTIGFTAYDASGAAHTTSVVLANDISGSGSPINNSQTIDAAITSINAQLQTSGDATLSKIVAVKADTTNASTGVVTQGIQFISSLSSFDVALGAGGAGQQGVGTATQQGTTQVSSAGNQSDISTAAGAATAVAVLTAAVTTLGSAQANVGKGENVLNYAVSLATTQVTNEAAAESRIRDANLAQQAANLSKAQILVQAGTAALAQANSAPQAILSLLK
jgi:flagellin